VKHWYTWISNTTSLTGEKLIYMNIEQYKYNWWNSDIHKYQDQCFTSYMWSVWYSSISMFHQLCMLCFIFMYINVSPAIFVVFDMHAYQYLISYTRSAWYSCKWWNIDIHEYQTVQIYLVKYWYTWISNTTSITGETLIYMNIKVRYSCISVFHQLNL
jgi:hypothetical protein